MCTFRERRENVVKNKYSKLVQIHVFFFVLFRGYLTLPQLGFANLIQFERMHALLVYIVLPQPRRSFPRLVLPISLAAIITP
jgi:hypothetical protein